MYHFSLSQARILFIFVKNHTMTHTIKCLLVLLFTYSTSFAQFKNIKLDDSSSTNKKCEPSVTINRKNPNNIIATTTSGNIYYSQDGGGTWHPVKVTSSASPLSDPSLISDDKGNIYSFHVATTGEGEKAVDQILCHVSNDGGKTWAPGASLGANSKNQNKPGAAVDGKGNVWVAWTQFDKLGSEDESCQSNILLSSSSNGKKWSKPIEISQTPGDCSNDDNSAKGAMPAIGIDGKAFLTWSSQNKILLDRSFSGGSLWLTNDIGVGQQHGGWDMKVPGYDRCSGMPVLMINQSKGPAQGTLYLVWADQKNGENDTDVWFIRSTNFGDNWTSPMKLGDDKNKRHQFSPQVAVDQTTGYIYVVYLDRDSYEDNQTDVILSYSTDSGSSFKSVKISETPFAADGATLTGNLTNISAHRGIIAPVWTRVDGSEASIWSSIIKQADLIQAPQTSSKKKK
jgi:photosystem II stability/assembly factor-like uncharacterized protein